MAICLCHIKMTFASLYKMGICTRKTFHITEFSYSWQTQWCKLQLCILLHLQGTYDLFPYTCPINHSFCYCYFEWLKHFGIRDRNFTLAYLNNKYLIIRNSKMRHYARFLQIWSQLMHTVCKFHTRAGKL